MGRGGKRNGAGRPKGSGKYGEPTEAMRVPQSLAERIKPILANWKATRTDVEAVRDVVRLHVLPSEDLLAKKHPELRSLDDATTQLLPLYSHSVAAGLPAPVADDVEAMLDLNQELTRDSTRSFCVRANGDSMIDAGINDGDIMLVDTSIEASDSDIVIAVVDSELTVKRLRQTPDRLWLQPENTNYPPIVVTEATDLRVIGVVTCTIRQFVC
ncbi:MAG: LexA family protein [Geitlerinemataceae cyanobacterium]